MNEQTIPVEATQNVVTHDVIIDGNVVDQGYEILSISISKEINRIPTAKIIIKDGNASEETFEISAVQSTLKGIGRGWKRLLH